MHSIGLRCSYLVVRLGIRMCSNKSSYEEAVQKLNKLQSNKSTINQIRKDIRTGKKCTNLEDMERYLLRTGVTLTKLDELSVIHVAGTKGKGSTSAMCESILRHHGYRTGFFSSPHLVAVRERIRLDGRIVSEEKFAQHFHQIYNMLNVTQDHDDDMPKYFAFLTVLAFNMFLDEKVDVAIIEVGIGGIVDYTNVLRKVPVVGITALGLDHTSILGSTLPEIAAAKAGVMKPGCEAYTVAQPPDAMEVLMSYADSVKCLLIIVPNYSKHTFPEINKYLPVNLEAYQTNASLATRLAHAWMRLQTQGLHKNGYNLMNGHKGVRNGTNGRALMDIPRQTLDGLRSCKWPGRYQIVQTDYVVFYLDGAHTMESIEICAHWFSENNSTQDKILIFSTTGDRNAEILLKPLMSIPFKAVYFVIPTAYKDLSQKNDNYSLVEQEELISRCKKDAEIWKKVLLTSNVTVLECVSDALISIKHNSKTADKSSVLVTGSLHLVGAALSILDPTLSGA